MRKHLLILAILFSLFLAPTTSHAGFFVKRKAEKTLTVATHNEDKVARQERRQEMLSTIMALLPHNDNDHECKGCKRHDGWQGTASLWCAIGGFFYFPPALILALVWGAKGMKPGAKHRKRAQAGVIIAIAGLFFWHLLITAAIWGL